MTPLLRRFALFAACTALAACGTNETRDSSAGEPGVVIGGDGGTFEGDGGADAGGGGGGGEDVGTPDDGGLPTLDVSPVDTGGGTDGGGGTTDGGGGGDVCDPGVSFCEGDILLTCNDDGTAIGRTRCAARDAFCVEEGDTAECVPFDELECEPGSEFCSDDGRALVICSDDGREIEEIIPCEFGCDDAEGECLDEGGGDFCDELPEVEAGDYAIDFCDDEDDAFYAEQRGSDCQDYGYGGPDTLAQFTLDEPATVLIDLRDDDGSAAIDTVLYLRADCEDQASQIACSDDVACEDSDVTTGGCVDGRQPRQSRLQVELDAGTYYIVADTLQYTSRRSGTEFGCGRGLLRIRIE